MSDQYFLLLKTADAEKRAWKNLADERKASLFPILELTRGRKNRGKGKTADGRLLTAAQLLQTPNVYGFEANQISAFELMNHCDKFFVDLTREPSLSCFEIEELSKSDNGYDAWTSFVVEKTEEYPAVLPTLIVNPSDGETEEQYRTNISLQFQAFSNSFAEIAYRVSVLDDEDFLYDLIALKPDIEAFIEAEGSFYVILDHEFVRPGNGHVHAKRTTQIISSVLQELPNAKIVCLATSFPKSVTDIGDEEHGVFRVEEMYLYDELRKIHQQVIYGDYGSINPIRNDELIIASGWRPRIDYVSRHEGLSVFYFREKRAIIGQKTVSVKGEEKKKNILAPYSEHYASVARKVIGFSPYYEDLSPSWGNGEIKAASKNQVPSNSPSHWISVRMEVHVIQVLKQLGLDPLS